MTQRPQKVPLRQFMGRSRTHENDSERSVLMGFLNSAPWEKDDAKQLGETR